MYSTVSTHDLMCAHATWSLTTMFSGPEEPTHSATLRRATIPGIGQEFLETLKQCEPLCYFSELKFNAS